MTREEAVRTIEEIKNCYTNDRDFSYYGDEYHGLTTYDNTALDMAIKALSEQTEDAISRDDALMCMTGEYLADQAYAPEDIISKHIKRIKALPSVTPNQRTGHWVKTIGENGITSAVRCSKCGFEDNRYMFFRYCPNCGCHMPLQQGTGRTIEQARERFEYTYPMRDVQLETISAQFTKNDLYSAADFLNELIALIHDDVSVNYFPICGCKIRVGAKMEE